MGVITRKDLLPAVLEHALEQANEHSQSVDNGGNGGGGDGYGGGGMPSAGGGVGVGGGGGGGVGAQPPSARKPKKSCHQVLTAASQAAMFVRTESLGESLL